MSDAHWYRAHGLLIRSAITLPELMPSTADDPDVVVEIGPEAAEAADQVPVDAARFGGFCESPSGPVLRAAQLGDVLVTKAGTRVRVTPHPGHDPGMLRLYLIGSVMGMVLHQRGRIILHGAAVAQPEGLSIFVGPSGAGKSTLAAHFARNGLEVFSDDLAALDEPVPGHFRAWPGNSVLKLHRDALERIGKSPDGLEPVNARRRKHFLPNPTLPADAPLPLAEVIVLESAEAPPALAPVMGLTALGQLAEKTYRYAQNRLLGAEERQFARLGRLSTSVPVLRLTRPWDAGAIEETLSLLRDHWAGTVPRRSGSAGR